MSLTSLAELREGLGAALESIEGLAVHQTVGGPYNVPCAVVWFEAITEEETRETMGRTGIVAVDVLIDLLVARADDAIASAALDAYMDWVGDLSVSAALEQDQTLGGVSQSVKWTGWLRPRPVDLEGRSALGAEVRFNVRLQRERI